MPEATILEEARVKLDTLIGTRKGRLKDLFVDSVKNGHTHESIGHLFEKSLEKFERKDMGQYYTPKTIVEYMISQLKITRESKVLDPACGCGSFLLTVFDVFKEKYGIQFLRNIFGVDINDDATNMTRLCLHMKSGFKDNYVSLIKQNIKTGNSIVSNRDLDRNAFDWSFEFTEVMKSGGFDFIIGNPPYVTLNNSKDFDPSESMYSQIIQGPVNAATLMIGKSLELLKENGVLAFLLPKSILYVDSYAKLRNYLAHNTEIIQIYDLGAKFRDVRGEQFILFIRKNVQKKESDVKVCTFNDKIKDLSEQSFITIKQDKLIGMGKFFTFDSQIHYELIAKMSNIGMKLNELVEGSIFRGLPVGGNHVAIEKDLPSAEHVIRGKDISKFRLKPLPVIGKKLLDEQSKGKIGNLKQRKVVLQNIFSAESGIIASYDPNKTLTLDTVTNIIVKDDEQGKYLLALLSSKLINFYIMYALFNRSRLTMHLDKSYLGSIPVIANPDKGKLNKIIKIMNFLLKNEDVDLRKSKNREIDEIVYNIYSLAEREIRLVEEATAKIFSKKSIW